MTKPKLLCVSYGGGHIRACLPVLGEMKARGWHVDLLALTTAYGVATHAGFKPWRALDLIEEGDEELLARGRQLSQDLPQGGVVSPDETAAYLGFGIQDLLKRHGPQKAQRTYGEIGRASFEHQLLASRAIDRFDPDVVLTTNSPRAERATILEAQKRGIPAALINDLLASASNHWLFDPTYADRIFVLNEMVRTRLIDSGHAPEKIIATGNPAFAKMIELRDKRKGRKPSSRPTILYASQPLPPSDRKHHVAMKAHIHKLARRRDDWIFRVRLHPNEPETGEWLSAPIIEQKSASLESDLLAADILVTHGSSVGMEAAIAGIPVVLQLGSQLSEEIGYDEMGIALPSHRLEDLEGTITRGLAGELTGVAEMPRESHSAISDQIEELSGNG